MARLLVEVVTAQTTGILLEAGGSGTGYALYIHDGNLVQDYGTGTAINFHGVEQVVDLKTMTLQTRFMIEVSVSSTQGAKIAINGVVLASHNISIGTILIAGTDPGGIGLVYGSTVRANRGGWTTTGQGVLTRGKIVQALVFPLDQANIIGRAIEAGNTSSPDVTGAIYTESSRVNNDYSALRAFDGRMFPTHTAGAAYTHWLQVQLPRDAVVFRYRLWAAPITSYIDAPIDWTLQASMDGTNWNIVDTRVNSMPPDTA